MAFLHSPETRWLRSGSGTHSTCAGGPTPPSLPVLKWSLSGIRKGNTGICSKRKTSLLTHDPVRRKTRGVPSLSRAPAPWWRRMIDDPRRPRPCVARLPTTTPVSHTQHAQIHPHPSSSPPRSVAQSQRRRSPPCTPLRLDFDRPSPFCPSLFPIFHVFRPAQDDRRGRRLGRRGQASSRSVTPCIESSLRPLLLILDLSLFSRHDAEAEGGL